MTVFNLFNGCHELFYLLNRQQRLTTAAAKRMGNLFSFHSITVDSSKLYIGPWLNPFRMLFMLCLVCD